MKRKRALFISTHFPSPSQPHKASFIRQQIHALSHHCNVDVVAPISWHSKERTTTPVFHNSDNINIYHPTLFYTPGLFRTTHGHFYALSISRTISSLFKSNNYDCIYSAWLYPDAFASAHFANKFNIPLYTRVMGTDVNRLTHKSNILKHSLHVIKRSKCVLSVSEDLKSKLIQLGAEDKKIKVLRNGIDRTIFFHKDKNYTRERLKIERDAQMILFVGNLKQKKGLLDLCKSFLSMSASKRFSNLQLFIIGEGPLSAELHRIALAAGCSDKMHILGSMPHFKISDWLNACDVFCLPSHSEGLPNVVIEALSCKTKVVATNVGGIPELVNNDAVLCLVSPHCPIQLQTAIENLLLPRAYPNNDYPCLTWDENSKILFDTFNDE